MQSGVHEFFQAQASLLVEGRVAAVAQGYSIPLVVALPRTDPGFIVLASRLEVEHVFRLHHAGLKRADVTHLSVEISDIRPTTSDRLVASVEWHHKTPNGLAGTTAARYFLEAIDAEPSVQMIEFQRLAFPSLVSWFREAGQPASQPPNYPVH